MEEYCAASQKQGEELMKKRDELAEVLRLFQIIEGNERNTTEDLKLELKKLQCETSVSESYDTLSFNEDTSQAMFGSGAINTLTELSTASYSSTPDVSTGAQMPLHPRFATSSGPNSSKATISSTWRQEFSSLVEDSKDISYISLPSTDAASTTEHSAPISAQKDGSRILSIVTTLKNSVSGSLNKGVLLAQGSPKPRYIGGSALKKTMPYKVRRQSRKPFVPIAFSKAHLTLKRKSSNSKRIGYPLGAHNVAGCSTHLGDPTMEPLRGTEAFDPVLLDSEFLLQSPDIGCRLEA